MNSSSKSSSSALQEFVFRTRYSRFNPVLGRRENWSEAVARVRSMHKARFAPFGDSVSSLIDEAFAGVESSPPLVLPSMRSLQFAGPAVAAHEARLYNCSAMHVSRLEAFRESFYLLLCGCGVGFSVQRSHVSKLPVFSPRTGEVVNHDVADTIEGWADSLHAVLANAIRGVATEFTFDHIRPKGALLKTSGGKAPGAEPLKKALALVDALLIKVQGRQLRSIEAYDILMFAAEAVLSGGVRRSATIALFSADDEEMMNAKTGDWLEVNRQRTGSNNSAVLIRGEATREQFDRLFEAQKEFGEPGFFFADSPDSATNPCCEIALHPVFVVRNTDDLALATRYDIKTDDDGLALRIGSRCSGVQMCNLVTINGSQIKTPKDFYRACRKAAIIGTLQADYTYMPYLSRVAQLLNDREALLGVSICGILDNPAVMLNPEVLRRGAEIVKSTNAEVAALIGINAAARTTCVKPEGTTSLLLGTGSGIHPHWARKHFRRIQQNRLDRAYQHFKHANPHMIEPSAYSDTADCVTFPVTIPNTAMVRADFTALSFLDAVLTVQKNWVVPGTAHQLYAPGVHNVSNTIPVCSDEWDGVADHIWENRGNITGVSLISSTGDKVYEQAPREAVITEDDANRFDALTPNEVNWDAVVEVEETSTIKQTVACAGGACELHV